MKFQFKIQDYQTRAVHAVADCFAGQPRLTERFAECNTALHLSDAQLLANIRRVQQQHALPLSERLIRSPASALNLDVEMETGTGKTYCYIKTMFALQKRFGWNKFVVVVPSIAVREGVLQAYRVTSDHFLGHYGQRARTFVYNAQQLHALEAFASDSGLQVMIINVQAFNTFQCNARLAAARVIFSERDAFQSRRPIDVLRATRPIMILDEPQRMGGRQTLRALAEFDPLWTLRYSATHKVEHNQVFRLDAVDAYRQKLVKKIAVRGFATTEPAEAEQYVYVEAVRTAAGKPPRAVLHWQQRTAMGVRRIRRTVKQGSDLYAGSNAMDAYRGWTVSEIDARGEGFVEFRNGRRLSVGARCGEGCDETLRRLQIREAIKAHLEKEQQLHARGIKVLTLFFIDAVAHYRRYDTAGRRLAGRYAEMFEAEYAAVLAEHRRLIDDPDYLAYVDRTDAARTHRGYFSIDNRTQRFVDSKVKRKGLAEGGSEDVSAYDLILKDKERLLSMDEPTRFLFTHSALREGWDNPNVFVIGMLKSTDYDRSYCTRRQEVGRGLRICVDQQGRRVDDPDIVHEVNVLTVVANESFDSFVSHLQSEIEDSLSPQRRGGGGEIENPLDHTARGRDAYRPRAPSPDHEACDTQARDTQALDTQPIVREELVSRCVTAMDSELGIAPQPWLIQSGHADSGMARQEVASDFESSAFVNTVRYDLITRLASETYLTRRTVVEILSGISPATFERFRHHPETFIAQTSRIIQQQMLTRPPVSIARAGKRAANGRE